MIYQKEIKIILIILLTFCMIDYNFGAGMGAPREKPAAKKGKEQVKKEEEDPFKITPEMEEMIKSYSFQKNQLTYNPEGRRDPFISLISEGSLAKKDEARPKDIRGMNISELALKGIFRGGFGVFAVVEGNDNKTYIIRQNDKVWDGTIKLIQANSVIFEQNVYDDLGNPKPPKIIEIKLHQDQEEE
jgi:Tfp pilus assembly protein PilP